MPFSFGRCIVCPCEILCQDLHDGWSIWITIRCPTYPPDTAGYTEPTLYAEYYPYYTVGFSVLLLFSRQYWCLKISCLCTCSVNITHISVHLFSSACCVLLFIILYTVLWQHCFASCCSGAISIAVQPYSVHR